MVGAIIEFGGFGFTAISLYLAWKSADGDRHTFFRNRPKGKGATVRVATVRVSVQGAADASVVGETELERRVRELEGRVEAVAQDQAREAEAREKHVQQLSSDIGSLRKVTVTDANTSTRNDVRLTALGVSVVALGALIQLAAMILFPSAS